MIIFDKDNLHHAHVCAGDKEQILESVLSFIKDDLSIEVVGNPDVRIGHFDNFGINDARSINMAQLKKSTNGGKMIFVMSLVSITSEAQNSLLKMFEEPTKDTYFFVITNTADIFLPTLLSRVEIKKHNGGVNVEIEDFVKNFIKSNKAERLVLLKKMIEEKDKSKTLDLLNTLETTLYEKHGASAVGSYEVIDLCRRYINNRGASVKMLLEYLALSL